MKNIHGLVLRVIRLLIVAVLIMFIAIYCQARGPEKLEPMVLGYLIIVVVQAISIIYLIATLINKKLKTKYRNLWGTLRCLIGLTSHIYGWIIVANMDDIEGDLLKKYGDIYVMTVIKNSLELIFWFMVAMVICCCCCRRDRYNHGVPKADQKTINRLTVVKRFMDWGMDDEEQCHICLDEYKAEDQTSKLPCGHLFHEACIEDWLKRSAICPYCTQPIQIAKDMHVVQVEQETTKDEPKEEALV